MYHLDDYSYELTNDRIAQSATHPPEACKLLYYDQTTSQINDLHFFDLPNVLDPSTLIVFNNSKVVKARLLFSDIQGELLFLRAYDSYTFEALVRPGKKRKVGQSHTLPGTDSTFTVKNITTEGRMIECSQDIFSVMEQYGQLPLPPYVDYASSKEADYQPIVADDTKAGSVAAPTAALHFSDNLLYTLNNNGHHIEYVTLHVGLGTFKSVDVDDITTYHIHHETAEVSIELFTTIAQQKIAKNPILAIGTTSTRTLESLPYLWKQLTHDQKKLLRDNETISYRDLLTQDITIPQSHVYVTHTLFHATLFTFNCGLYIYPGFQFRIIDQLITNFHLPKSSLLMLVAGFIGYETMKKLYTHALQDTYRFFSFGDAMLLKKNTNFMHGV